MNELKTDYPSDLKLWTMYFFHHYISVNANKYSLKKLSF